MPNTPPEAPITPVYQASENGSASSIAMTVPPTAESRKIASRRHRPKACSSIVPSIQSR